MKSSLLFWILTVAVVSVAGALRLSCLSQRPLHTDEAVHAEKYGNLLDRGFYKYNANEYHGPTLNYSTFLLARLRGQLTYQALDEVTLRLGPALMGLFLVILPLGLLPMLDRRVVLWLIGFTALSPAFVYYSRYYIQEMYLVCFTFGLIVCIWRYLHTRHIQWIVLAGLCAGFMHASKETCVIAFGSMALAAVTVYFLKGRRRSSLRSINPLHIGLALGVAVVTSALCFSSFLSRPEGILDSYKTYAVYLGRAGAGGSHHHHGFFYYLDLLTWIELLEWPPWNEDFTVVMALLGCVWAFKRKTTPTFVCFMAVYTLLMTLIYSAIPYKTPWCFLGFLHGMLLLSAFAVREWLGGLTARWERIVFWIVIGCFGLASPLAQAWALSFRHDSDPKNPYVYAHTTHDVFDVVDQVSKLPRKRSNGEDVKIRFVCPGKDYWPLPWYLRDMNNVGYQSAVDMNEPTADVYIIKIRNEYVQDIPDVEANLIHRLYDIPEPGHKEMFLYFFDHTMQLRPWVELRGYIRKTFSDEIEQGVSMP